MASSFIAFSAGSYSAISGSSFTANGTYFIPVSGMKGVRIITTSWTSGTITITGIASRAPLITLIGGIVNVSGNMGVGLAGQQTDVASAAITTTATTGNTTPSSGLSYLIAIPVTVVTGTTPTIDIQVQESDDAGTNWFAVWDIPRITTTGVYRTPKLPVSGNRIRYVQTVAGTTPSFTRAIYRVQYNEPVTSSRQIIDRTISLTTLSSTTPSLLVSNCNNLQLTVNIGAVTTTAPAVQLQISQDGGATYSNIGTPLTAIASSTVTLTVNNINAQFVRAIVTTAGIGVTAGSLTITGR